MFTCKFCGSEVVAGQAFCTKCGADVADNYESVCSSCGTKNDAGSRYCAKCGNILGVLRKPVCEICGAKNLPGAKFCVSCGAPILPSDETHDGLDVIEMRKTKLRLDLLVKERMKGIDKEIAAKRAKMLDDKEKGMKEVEDYRAKTNAELLKQARMLDAYKKKVDELGSEDVAKLKKISHALKEVATYYADPYSEFGEDQIETETYVCPICGAINPLSVTACLHCGRDRARSTLLLAKGKIKQSPPVRRKVKKIEVPEVDLQAQKTPTFEEFAGAEFEKAQTKPIEVQKPDERQVFTSPTQAPYMPAQGAGAYPPPYYPYPPMPYGGVAYDQNGTPYQMPPIVQPVAFVPYVTQEQPLMQYVPAEPEKPVQPTQQPVNKGKNNK
ncbi:MAG: zinc-ribbon domain-containing protein [Clostridia bacterium]|nr:zinc-ribbon domain-containing protein [Clostridia bacterium]